MSITRTIGGDRLGSGNKLKVELHGYGRSTHDMGYLWRSTMSAGTLVPFLFMPCTPGDTLDINLDCDIKTHPTIAPLFGSEKVQLDIFTAPMRLYIGLLHNNKINIGMNMSQVKIPIMRFTIDQMHNDDFTDIDNAQVNPSCLLAYLGIRGIGWNDTALPQTREMNAMGVITYWDIFKNYYANKMEEKAWVIHNRGLGVASISAVYVQNAGGSGQLLPQPLGVYVTLESQQAEIQYPSTTGDINLAYIIFQTSLGEINAQDLFNNWTKSGTTAIKGSFNKAKWNNITVYNYRLAGAHDTIPSTPSLHQFDLSNIDAMRDELQGNFSLTTPVELFGIGMEPYNMLEHQENRLSSQEGLAVKTYQSDLLNMWVNTDYIDGTNGINAITAIDTSGGEFTLDTLNLAKKVYMLLNRIAVSGGSYKDWLDTVWTSPTSWQATSPMYCGGLIKELVFQEVISNSATDQQALGTLGGRGVMGKKHKGGHVIVKVDEPSYVMGIISITPRIDYSQGNDWHTYAIRTMDDLHKPQLDEIGFQDLIMEQMAWWNTFWNGVEWEQQSAGKQPAWLNYMTNINRTYGNFAIKSNEMFMTFNRRYEWNGQNNGIVDLTTYIDPAKFNFIFASTALDAQNYWVQVAVNIEARRVISAKQMPNL